MKNLRKALAVALSASVMCMSASAFAQVISVENTNPVQNPGNVISATYNDGAVEVSATGAEAGEMTFVILNKAVVGSVEANDIVYLDQATFSSNGKIFTGAINPDRMPTTNDVIDNGGYPIKVGYNYDGNFVIYEGILRYAPDPTPTITGITTTTSLATTCGVAIPLVAAPTVDFEGEYDHTVDWTLDSADEASLDARIYNDSGTMKFVANKVGTAHLTVAAHGDPTKTASVTVTVGDSDPTLSLVTITGLQAATTGTDVTLTATPNKTGSTITWHVKGGLDELLTDNGDGTATVNSATAQTVTVYATATSPTTGLTVDSADYAIVFSEPETPPEPEVTITVRWGDVNGDGYVSGADSLSILFASNSVFESYELTDGVNNLEATLGDDVTLKDDEESVEVRWGDVNGDGYISGADSLSVLFASNSVFEQYTIGTIDFIVGSDCNVVVPKE